MKIFTSCLIISFFTTISTYGQYIKQIIFYDSKTERAENNLGIAVNESVFSYRAQYENLKTSNVNQDVELALCRGDYRVVSIMGYSDLFPGLEGGYQRLKNGEKEFIALDAKYERYIENGFKTIAGTSDMIHYTIQFQLIAYEYAKNYNLLLISRIR